MTVYHCREVSREDEEPIQNEDWFSVEASSPEKAVIFYADLWCSTEIRPCKIEVDGSGIFTVRLEWTICGVKR